MNGYCIRRIFATALLLVSIHTSFAWGKTGHEIVAQIAMQFLTDAAKEKVNYFLDGMSIEDASTWMDSMRSNSDYDFMKPWHYLDFNKGLNYSTPSNDDNIVSRLSLAYGDLKHYGLLCNQQVQTDILYLFHLIGDLHQPLHTGYAEDKGGNTIMAYYGKIPSNLHKIWDEVIIDSSNITMKSCLSLVKEITPEQLADIQTINFISWYNESRLLLDSVYDFPEFTLDENYIAKNKKVIERRLLYAGIRLAGVLNTLFTTSKSIVPPPPLKNSITADESMQYVNKKVTVCTKVFSIKELDKVSFMDVGAQFPHNPLTIVIFAKDRANFKPSLALLYTSKYICVTGTVVLYKEKPEIIVARPDDIIVQ